MDPQRRHLKKLKRLQQLRKEKMKERNETQQKTETDKENVKLASSVENDVVDKKMIENDRPTGLYME